MRPEMSEFKVKKLTRSYADTLEALGLANLVEHLSTEYGEVTISNRASEYVISIDPPLRRDDVVNWIPHPLYRFVAFGDKDEKVPPLDRYFDYQRERQLEAVWKAAGQKRANVQSDEEAVDSRPSPELTVYKMLNTMRKGSTSFNQLWWQIRSSQNLPQWLAWKLGFDDEEPEFPEEKDLQRSVSPLQFFQPLVGKGTNKTKPSGTGLGSLPDRLVDWWREWLKYQGFQVGLVAYFTGPQQSDNKLVVVDPKKANLSLVRDVREKLLTLSGGPVKLDIAAILTTLRTLLKYNQYASDDGRWNHGTPKDIVQGLSTAYFSDMGAASAVTNVSYLGIPGWIPVRGRDDVEAWFLLLDEHEKCVRGLREENSSDMEVLLKYRKFLSTGILHDALDFFVSYGIRAMQLRGENKYAYFFSTETLGRIFMSYDLERIIHDEGFQNIATAIRQSTVSLQQDRANNKPIAYEIRYGLAQDWRRKSKHVDEFVAALAQFVQSYNYETERLAEQRKAQPDRKLVRIEDLDSVFALIKTYGPELVASLLLAYGYSRHQAKKNNASDGRNTDDN